MGICGAQEVIKLCTEAYIHQCATVWLYLVIALVQANGEHKAHIYLARWFTAEVLK